MAQSTVIDASVMVKWFLDEPGSGSAEELREAHVNNELVLCIPDFALLETLNVLRYKGFDLYRAQKDLQILQLETIRLDDDLLRIAGDFALEYDLSLYDALYAVVARRCQSELITADTSLAQVPGVRLLH